MVADVTHPEFTAHALLEFPETDPAAGATCALLTPAIKATLKGLAPGQVLEVRVADPSAREDILSWSRLSGNAVLAMYADGPRRLRFYVQKK